MRSLHVVMASMARVAQISPLHDSIQADMAQGEGGRGEGLSDKLWNNPDPSHIYTARA